MEFHPDGSMKVESRCPSCGKQHTAARNALDENHTPEPGDWTVCWYCANVLRFTEDYGTRIPSLEEIAEFRQTDNQAYRTIRAMQAFVEQRQKARIVREAIEDAVGARTPPNPENN